MSSSNASWSNRDSNYAKPTASSRSRTLPQLNTQMPSYVDILTTPSGKDWLEAYEFPTLTTRDDHHHRRTLSQATEKPTVSVRKTKSLKETPRTKLRSPPPPPPPPQEDTSLLKQQPFNSKVKRKLSFSKPVAERSSLPANPRRTVSSSVIQQDEKEQYSNTLAEYQGYSRQSRHRSFTYSPPPPRTSSLKTPAIPSSVPPVPPVPKHHVSSTALKQRTSIKKKQGDSSYTSSRSNSRAHASPEYKMNLSQDLAQIEQDIKALEIQRQSFITAHHIEPKTIGRKRGKVRRSYSCFYIH